MKNWLTYIILLMAGTLVLLTTSCSQDDDDIVKAMNGDGKLMVEFSIALGNTGVSSRTTWGKEYLDSIGNGFDNSIKLDSFYVKFILPGNDTLDVERSYFSKSEPDKYKFVGKVFVEDDEDRDLTGGKVIVYANVNEDDTDFNANLTNIPGKGVNYIPMWGVHTIESSESFLPPSDTLHLQKPILLLRAMAKIELTLTDDMVNEGYSIEGVTINKYNSTGNLVPTGEHDYTIDYYRESCINVSTANNIESRVGGFPFTEISENRYWIYVPEFLIDMTDSFETNNDIQITVDLYKGTQKFPEERSTFSMIETSLVRNHWYIYTITSANMEEDVFFNLKYKVIDWQDIDNGTLNFGDHNGNVN